MKKYYTGLLQVMLLFISLSAFSQIGVMDYSFGHWGVVYTRFDSMNVQGKAIAVQGDSSIVVATDDGSKSAILIRYKENGSLDSSFGNNGKVITLLNAAGTYSYQPSVAIQPDGKIIWAGSITGQQTIVRYQTNGHVDSTFGNNGMVVKPIAGGFTTRVHKIIIKTDGNILIESSVSDGITYRKLEMSQLKPDGSIDPLFGTNGVATIGRDSSDVVPHSMALQSDGKIVIAGEVSLIANPAPDYDFAALRLLDNGTVDSTYGTNGWAITDLGFPNDSAVNLAIQSDNKVVLVGSSAPYPANNVNLVRYDSTGRPDSTFGVNGKVFTLFKNTVDLPASVHVQTDGLLLVAGSTDSGYFASMRISQFNGSVVGSYSRYGIVLSIMPGTMGEVYASALQPDGKLIFVGKAILDSVDNVVLARLEAEPFPLFDVPDFSEYHGPININYVTAFVDSNANGIMDSNEPLYNDGQATVSSKWFLHVQAIHGTDSIFVLDSAWSTKFDVGLYHTSTPFSYQHHFSDSIRHTVYDTFAISPAQSGIRDASIHLFAQSNVARTGTVQKYNVVCKNKGTDTIASGTATFVIDHKLTYVNAVPAPSSINGDTLTWNIANMLQQQSDTMVVSLAVPWPPAVTLHDYLYFSGTITSDKVDIYPPDNFDAFSQIIGNAYDPNGKSEVHHGSIAATAIAAGEYLKYTISFQNTGNDTALNVYVKDVLDISKVIPSTFEIIGSSHSMRHTLQNGIVIFTFENINLPDSNVNEEASHGYITYRIRPKDSLLVGDVINNAASIYFGQNPAVITNTETTTVTGQILPMKLLSFTARKQNKTNLLQWSTANEVNADHFDIERSPIGSPATGRDFSIIGKVKAYSTTLNQYSYTDNFQSSIPPLGGGGAYYRLKMTDRDGKFTYSPVRAINNSSTFSVSIYPNPAKDNLQVQIDSDKQTALQLQIISHDGKVLLSNNTTTTTAPILRSINISALAKGNYYLKVFSLNPPLEGREAQVVKFEKL